MTRRSARGPSMRLVLTQSMKAIVRRPGRAVATATGVALGIAVLLTSIGFASTVDSEVNATFDATSATQIRVQDADDLASSGLFDGFRDGPSFDDRAGQLEGVVAAGMLWQVGDNVSVRTSDADPTVHALTLLSGSPGVFAAAQAEVASGRIYDDKPLSAGTPIVVLGPRAASDLGLERVRGGQSIEVNGRRAVVAGILSTPGSAPELSSAVVMSPAQVDALGLSVGAAQGQGAIVRTELGAAQAVSRALPLLIRPDDPERVGLLVPPDLSSLRDDVQGSLNGLAVGVAGFSVLVGAVGIMNSMMISVTQRSSEIGLRRALGATRRWILTQFLTEGLVLGFVGAAFGTALAVLVLVVVAGVNDWSPVIDPILTLAAPPAGAIVGLLAAAYPAGRAARLEPAVTLKR